jgi:5-formyltetrahydrofolate cyclo-ligase
LHIVLPKADPKTFAMAHYLYNEQTNLQLNEWGVSEPADGETVAPTLIDMVIIPLIAFDEKGYRVGYGKGFYDRFLAQCRKNTVKIGLSIEAPVPKITDINQYDIPMDYCLTPEKIWRFV